MKTIHLIILSAGLFLNQTLKAQWMNISLPSLHTASQASFPDDMHGYVASTSSPYLFRTINGGTSWDSVMLSANAFDVEFISADTGFVIAGTFSQGFLLTTYDGGNSWSSDSLLPGYYGTLVHFVDAQNGYVTTNFSDVLKTTDGGTSWTAVPTGGYCSASDKENTGSDSIVFTGWDGTFAYQGSVLRSDNSGISFTEHIYNVNYTQFFGSHFLTPSFGFAVHNSNWPTLKNYVSKTTNGGMSWDSVVVDTNTAIHYEDVLMINDSEGYVVAGNWPQGTIHHIMGNMSSIEQTVPYGLKRIFRGGNTMFATGDGGLVYKKEITLSVEPTVELITGMYPNPASNFLYIPTELPSTVTLYDLNGRMLKSSFIQPNEVFQLPDVPNGMYIIKMNNGKGISSGKIIIRQD